MKTPRPGQPRGGGPAEGVVGAVRGRSSFEGEDDLPHPCPWPVRQGKVCGKPAAIRLWCRSHATDEADRRFRVLVKRRDPRCRACMKAESSDCAHIFTRGRWPTRWDLTNAVGLCRPCHRHYTDHPNQWEDWVITVVFDNDEALYEQLGYQSKATERGAPSVDVESVLDRLEEVAYG